MSSAFRSRFCSPFFSFKDSMYSQFIESYMPWGMEKKRKLFSTRVSPPTAPFFRVCESCRVSVREKNKQLSGTTTCVCVWSCHVRLRHKRGESKEYRGCGRRRALNVYTQCKGDYFCTWRHKKRVGALRWPVFFSSHFFFLFYRFRFAVLGSLCHVFSRHAPLRELD